MSRVARTVRNADISYLPRSNYAGAAGSDQWSSSFRRAEISRLAEALERPPSGSAFQPDDVPQLIFVDVARMRFCLKTVLYCGFLNLSHSLTSRSVGLRKRNKDREHA
jgi:hypothetical protein